MLITVIGVISSSIRKKSITENDFAIITAPSVTAKSSPDHSGTSLFVIHEGVKVEVEDEVNDWYEIRLMNGNKGWIPKAELERI